MMLRDVIRARGMSMADAARALGIGGVNPGGTLARIADGARPADADMVERIIVLFDGAVSATDMHAVRLAWLRQHRPEKLFTLPATAEAAE